jgi:hypothetical protein
MMLLKSYYRYFLVFTSILLLVPQALCSSQALINPQRIAIGSMCALGLGARCISERVVREVISYKEESTLESKQSVRACAIALQVALRVYLEHQLKQKQVPAAALSALLAAYDMGIKIPLVFDFTSAIVDVAHDAGRAGIAVGKELAYALRDGAGLAFKGALPIVSCGSVHDLNYPLKNSHSTALTCGTRDSYCSQSGDFSRKAKDPALWSNPDELVLGLARLGFEGAAITLGSAFALASHHVGGVITALAAQLSLSDASSSAPVLLTEKLLDAYVDITVLDWLKEELVDCLARFLPDHPEARAEVTRQDIH